MIKKSNLLVSLQKQHTQGGYALVSPKSGRVAVFAENLKKLYQTIEKKQIDDAQKIVMYIPPPKVKHVFRISLSVRFN